MEISLIFDLERDTLPSPHEQLDDLRRVAKLLEPLGFPIDEWYPPARTVKKSLANRAFDCNGPTSIALNMLQARERTRRTVNHRMASIWNGAVKSGAVVFSSSLSADVNLPRSVFSLELDEGSAFDDASNMRQFIRGLLGIWPRASRIEAGPLVYYTTRKVFRERAGAGWMLYLPTRLGSEELPEAAELIPIMDGEVQKGTLIVSVADTVFSIENPEHVRIANAIEIRLADQDRLPR